MDLIHLVEKNQPRSLSSEPPISQRFSKHRQSMSGETIRFSENEAFRPGNCRNHSWKKLSTVHRLGMVRHFEHRLYMGSLNHPIWAMAEPKSWLSPSVLSGGRAETLQNLKQSMFQLMFQLMIHYPQFAYLDIFWYILSVHNNHNISSIYCCPIHNPIHQWHRYHRHLTVQCSTSTWTAKVASTEGSG